MHSDDDLSRELVYSFLKGEVERVTLISSLWWPVVGHDNVEWSCMRGSSDWKLEKVLHWKGGSSLDQAPQGSGHGTKPVRVQRVSGWSL